MNVRQKPFESAHSQHCHLADLPGVWRQEQGLDGAADFVGNDLLSTAVGR
jgi:hypothetical protein